MFPLSNGFLLAFSKKGSILVSFNQTFLNYVVPIRGVFVMAVSACFFSVFWISFFLSKVALSVEPETFKKFKKLKILIKITLKTTSLTLVTKII